MELMDFLAEGRKLLAYTPSERAAYDAGEAAIFAFLARADVCQPCSDRILLTLLDEHNALRARARAVGLELEPEEPHMTAWRCAVEGAEA